MEKSIKPLMTSSLPAGEYREKLIELFFAKFHSKVDLEELLNLVVPIYDKYLSDEDIKGLIEFYSTPLGQKALTVVPKVMAEAQDEGRKWGQNVGRDCMKEVLAEHPEFMKDLASAHKNTQPAPQ
jgi:hypothetical protein